MRSGYNNGDLHGAAWPGCLGSVYMQNYLILLEYTRILRLVGRYFAISWLLFSRIVAVDID